MCELKRNLWNTEKQKNQIENIVAFALHTHASNHSHIVRASGFFFVLFGIFYFMQKMNKKNCIKFPISLFVRCHFCCCCWFASWCLVMRIFFCSCVAGIWAEKNCLKLNYHQMIYHLELAHHSIWRIVYHF